jgi:hypothetical protein
VASLETSALQNGPVHSTAGKRAFRLRALLFARSAGKCRPYSVDFFEERIQFGNDAAPYSRLFHACVQSGYAYTNRARLPFTRVICSFCCLTLTTGNKQMGQLAGGAPAPRYLDLLVIPLDRPVSVASR